VTQNEIRTRAIQVARLYDWGLELGAYGFELDFEPEEAVAETFGLANALLQAERERLARAWSGLEQLLALVPPGGSLDEVIYLPAVEMRRALLAAYDCGWLRDAPSPEDA
jgi:hypothetical protein